MKIVNSFWLFNNLKEKVQDFVQHQWLSFEVFLPINLDMHVNADNKLVYINLFF